MSWWQEKEQEKRACGDQADDLLMVSGVPLNDEVFQGDLFGAVVVEFEFEVAS